MPQTIKLLNGLSKNLPSGKEEGTIYFTRDDNYFYIDHKDKNGTLIRSKISAEYADKLRYLLDGQIYELSAEDVAAKAQVQIFTWEDDD